MNNVHSYADVDLTNGISQYQMYIDGQWTNGHSDSHIDVENPATEQIIAQVPSGCAKDATQALDAASKAQPAWAALTAIERGDWVKKLAQAVKNKSDHLAKVIVCEQGKPLAQAKGEVAAMVNFLSYSAEQARRVLGDVIPSDHIDEEIFIRRLPYGVVVALTAWNYPAALVARKLAPALVAGNTIVIKAHECTPLSALELAKLCEQVGIPAGVVNVVTGDGIEVGDALVRSEKSDLVTMTGSNRAGQQIYAAGAQQIKVLRLELGGKAPFIVMDDADIEQAVEAAVTSRFTNCGQICTCNERMYLHKDIAEQFTRAFVEKVQQLQVGDPMYDLDIGPKVNADELNKIAQMVDLAVSEGAQILTGGNKLTEGIFSRGHWFEPTVLKVTSNDLSIMHQEIFGPVIPLMEVESYEQALELANDTQYGLSAYVFTKDLKRIMNLKTSLQFGEIYVNRSGGEMVQGFHNGWNSSGIGGEDGPYGFDNYLRKQTTYLSW